MLCVQWRNWNFSRTNCIDLSGLLFSVKDFGTAHVQRQTSWSKISLIWAKFHVSKVYLLSRPAVTLLDEAACSTDTNSQAHNSTRVGARVCGGGWGDCLLRRLIHCNAANVCFSLQIQLPLHLCVFHSVFLICLSKSAHSVLILPSVASISFTSNYFTEVAELT